MDNNKLNIYLQKTGKARFVDWVEYCLKLEETNDIIEEIKSQKEYGYTQQSYITRVNNIKTIIKAERLVDALLIIVDSGRLDKDSHRKALGLLDKIDVGDSYTAPFLIEMIRAGADRLTIIKARIGQNAFRKALIYKWNGCSVTGYRDILMLVASHIKPWKLSNANEKIDPNNGLLLVPNLDKAFDKGYITFDDNGEIIISHKFSNHKTLGITKTLKIEIPDESKKFMKFHREEIFS